MTFADFFEKATKHKPYPWQQRLADAEDWPLVLDVPTGAGKTAVILVWLWRLQFASNEVKEATPRRLAFCLPMRTLVEQTVKTVEKWLEEAELTDAIGCHQLMGGAVAKNWDIDPVKPCILIGTQDQLLSRALNRGYAMSRYRWPVQFALLNNDCLWVLDEVQLMGIGAKTAAQLQGLREKLGTYGPVKTLWMSATLDESVVRTVDHRVELVDQRLGLSDADREGALQARFQAAKRLQPARTSLDAKQYASDLAAEIVEQHKPGSLTLVVCNRVARSQDIYRALQKRDIQDLLLVHSRFRAGDRRALNEFLLSENPTGIVVATQAIEAGIDLSARVLFTELAPRSSLVQRFGRCNRAGQQKEAQIFWIDIPDLEGKKGANLAIPYDAEELKRGREFLQVLKENGGDAGPQSLAKIESEQSQPIPGQIPRRRDVLQLFDTSVDLAGHDIDVSRFIRQTDDTDLAFVWRHWENAGPPPANAPKLDAAELCRVSFRQAKTFLAAVEKQRKDSQDRRLQPWVWDGVSGSWAIAHSIYPGQTILLPTAAGGYSNTLGFTGNPKDRPQPVPLSQKRSPQDSDGRDRLSQLGTEVTLPAHAQHVADRCRQLCEALSGFNLPADLIERAGRWHDLGKAMDVFQVMLNPDFRRQYPERLLAKSAESAWYLAGDRRPFRHELASALVALDCGEPFLLCYLVAAHHGKVRLTIQPRPTEPKLEDGRRLALGIQDGDPFPAVDLGAGVETAARSLSLACMDLGSDRSWTAQATELLAVHGPFRLAFLEMLIRVADWQASKMEAEQDILEVE